MAGGIDRPGGAAALRRLERELDQVGIGMACTAAAAEVLGRPGDGDLERLSAEVDLVVAIGGDGTLLRAVRAMADLSTPILGLNTGRLGFLSFAGRGEEAAVAAALAEGRFAITLRTLLDIRVQRDGNGSGSHAWPEADGRRLALNEVTITRGAIARMILLRASLDGRVLTDYHADGLIVATPTGSSAYSLSAGGPIVMPDSETIVLTPICPHALSSRPVVVPDGVTIGLEPQETARDADIVFTVDGQSTEPLQPGDRLLIRRAEEQLPLVMPQDWNFTDTLRRKLDWKGSNV